MKYYSDITKQLYETREELFKAERDYKTKLIAKARADEKAKKDCQPRSTARRVKGRNSREDNDRSKY